MNKFAYSILCVCLMCCTTVFAGQIIRVNSITAPGGQVDCANMGGGLYQLTASSADGYTFLSWSDGIKTAQRTFYKSSSPSDTLHAVFVNNDVNKLGGEIDVQIASVSPLTYTLTAVPRSCYSFWKWNNGSTNATINYATTDCVVEAFYRKPKIGIRNIKCAGGEILVREDTCSYHLTAQPLSGYVFIGWSDNVYGSERDVEFGEDSLAAKFIPFTQLATISDWNNNIVVLRSNYDLSGYEMRTSIDSSSTFVSSSLSKLDEGVYIAQVPQLDGAAEQELNLRFINTCGGLASLQSHEIPIIVASNITSALLQSGHDIYIQKGAKLTVNSTLAADTVVVYGGGKLSVPYGQNMTANTVILRAGNYSGSSYDYCFPQLFVEGSLNKQSLSYDYLLNNAVWYPLSVPQMVNLSSLKFLSGNSAQNKFIVEYYDGQERTKHISGWRDVKSATLTQGVGYNLFMMPETVYTGGKNVARKYSRISIPLSVDLSDGENKAPTVAVKAYGVGQSSVDFVDMGWNFIGNPYMADYLGDLMLNGNPINYVTIPSDDGQSYTQEVTEVAQLPAFRNFFIQTEESGNLVFDRSYRLRAPKRLSNGENEDIIAGLVLSSADYVDRVGVRIGDRYTSAYDINADLLKFDNAKLNVYALSATNRLAFIATNKNQMNNIPIGYFAPKGQYTFALNTNYDNNQLEHLYLYDSQTKIYTDLLKDTYTFSSSAGRFDSRFTISCQMMEISTCVLTSEEGESMKPEKRLINGQLLIYYGDQIFDALGTRVK